MGGVTLGMAAWSMHFIGMLAYRLPIPVSYDPALTLLSILPVAIAGLLGFYVLRESRISLGRIVAASLWMGAGIGAMHYTGMAALEISPPVSYRPSIVILSLVIAVLASAGAFLMMYQGERLGLERWTRFVLGGMVMGLAISSMHYTAMGSVHIHPDSVSPTGSGSIEPAILVLLVTGFALLLFASGQIAALFDLRMARQNAIALEQLQVAHTHLERRAGELAEQMIRELRGRDERFELLLESVAEAIYGVDLHGNCVFANSSCLRILGFEKEELLGQHIHPLIHHTRPDGSPYPSQECCMYQAFQLHQRIHVEDEVFWRKDGSSFPVEYWSHPILHEGQIVGAVATFFDITERKRAEKELRIAATAFEVQEAIMITDARARIIRVNGAFTRITGYGPEETAGHTPAMLKSVQHNPDFYRGLLETIRKTRHWQGEIWNRRKDGEVFP